MLSPYLNLWKSNKIGKGTTFGAFCDIGGIEIGENCKVQSHVSIPPGWKIGNNVFIGPGVHFANDKHPQIGLNWSPQPGIVEDNVSIGMGALIGPGVKIGANVVIGMGAVVTHDVIGGSIVIGNPAKPLIGNAFKPYDVP